MKYYKLVSGNLVVDAICDEDAKWIVENRHNYSTFIGQRNHARGVLSSDGTKVWHLHGTTAFHDYPDYTTVQLIEVERAEYEALIDELAANGVITLTNDSLESLPIDDSESLKTAKSPAIIALEEQVQSLTNMNDMLVECVLELSEIVYGGDMNE